MQYLKSPRLAHFIDFGLVLGGTAFATGTSFVLKVLIGRMMGPDQLGIFGVCYAFLTIVSMLADLGVRYSVINLASRSVDKDPERARRLVFGGLLLKLGGGVLVALVGWLLAPYIALVFLKKAALVPFLRITAVGVCLWALWDAVEGAVQVKQKFSWGAACRIVLETLRLLAFAALWGYAGGTYLSLDRYMWLYFATPLAALAIGAVMIAKLFSSEKGHPAVSSADVKELIVFARGIFFYRSASMVLLFMDSLMLTRYGELKEVGLYEAAKGLAFALLLVSESLQQVLLPKVNQIKTIEEVKQLVKRSGRYFAVLFASAIVWMLAASPFLSLFGEAFTRPGVRWTFYLMVTVTLFTIPSAMWSTVLLTLDQPLTLGCIASSQVLLGLLLYPQTIPLGGPMATAGTALALQVYGAFAYGLALVREVRRRQASKPPAASS